MSYRLGRTHLAILLFLGRNDGRTNVTRLKKNVGWGIHVEKCLYELKQSGLINELRVGKKRYILLTDKGYEVYKNLEEILDTLKSRTF